VIFGESYETAARRELLEETGTSAPLRYLGKSSHHDPPEKQMVAVFTYRSDKPVVLDLSEATTAEFYTTGEIDGIVESAKIAPWLRDGWKLARDKL
jgi:NADH pyrophosphatase NudC (nudix superfamily)